jgi:iron complex outermembrane recepter protein
VTFRTYVCALLAFLVFTQPRLYSQTNNNASIRGTVTDVSGALISNATISVQPIGNEATLTTSTGADGEFTMSGLVPDTYIVTAQQLGFNKVFQTVTLAPGQNADVALVLNLNVVNQNVTVTAQSAAVTESPTAQTITSVGYQDTKDAADFTIQESLNLVPGITTLTGNGPRDISISLRGSNDRQDYGIRNAILFDDGFQVTQPDGLGRADLVDPHAYGSIDAVQGPSSTLYGNDAIEGAIFFHTRPGAEIRGIDFGTDVGSYQFLNNYVSIGNAGENYDYSIFFSNTRGKQSYIPNFEFNSATANILTTYWLTQKDRVIFKFINNDTDTALPVRLSAAQFNANPFQRGCVGLTLTNNTAATNPNNCSTDHVYINGFAGAQVYISPDVAQNGRHDRRTIVGARWEHDFTKNTTLRTQGVWDDKDIDQPTGATTARGSTPSFIFNSNLTRTGLLWGHHSTTYVSAFLKYEDTNSYGYNLTSTGAQGALTSGAFGTIIGTGFHFREELSLGDRATIVGGFGYEHTDLTDGETLYSYTATAAPTTAQFNADHIYNNYSPEAAVLLRASNALRFHARLGTGYATPVNSAFFTTSAGVYGNNTSLEAATNVGIDFGADWLIARYITLSATGFYERYANENITQTPGAGLLSNTFNVPSSAHRGLVAGIDWHPLPSLVSGLRFRAAYQLDDQIYRNFTETLDAAASGSYPAVTASFNRAGLRIPGVIPNNLSVRLAYDNTSSEKGDFGIYVETSYRSSLGLDNANLLSAPSATVMNYDIHYDPSAGHGLWSRTHFYFDLLNFANRTYIGSTNNATDVLANVKGVGVESSGASLATNATGLLYVGAPRLSIGGFRIHF